MKFKYLAASDILRIHNALVALFATTGDPIFPPGPRDLNLIESACMRPQTALGDVEKYSSIYSKTAALFHSLIMNHPFHNGNKRTALVSALTFLETNRHRIKNDVSDDEIFTLVTSIAAGTFSSKDQEGKSDRIVEDIAAWIREHSQPRTWRGEDMSANEFLDACRQAGALVRQSKGSWVIIANGNRRRLSRSCRKLDAGVIKNYVTALGLAGSVVGIYIDEFQDAVPTEDNLMKRFRSVLNRLANA